MAWASTSNAAQSTELVEACSFDPAQEIAAVPDDAVNSLFHAYGDSNSRLDDWTGGDTTNSVLLPDGRVVWIFSDTFLGAVDADHSRRTNWSIVNNTFVLQSPAGELTGTLHGGNSTHPDGLVTTGDPTGSTWYWMGDGTVDGGKLRVFVIQFEKFGPDVFDFRWVGNGLATFSLPKLKLESVTPVVSSNNVQYGSGILEDGGYVYVYGTEDQGRDKYMHVARAPAGALTGPWEFFTGVGWSPDPAASLRLLHGVANEYSVTRVGDAYLLITQDTTIAFSRDIFAYVSCSPTGPWAGPKHLYTAPDYPFSNAFAYNAHAHPEFTREGQMLVSYNVNSLNFQDVIDDVHVYRPRFIRFPIPTILRAAH